MRRRTPEDFVLFKILSTRELDLEDAASVLRALGSDLDIALLEAEIEGLAESVGSHPVRERWGRLRDRQ